MMSNTRLHDTNKVQKNLKRKADDATESKENHTTSFSDFLKAVQENNCLEVERILNTFPDAESRANFANRQDEDGNSAYHHATMQGHAEVIKILNCKKKYLGQQKFILFTQKNKAKLTPLDIACEKGDYPTFSEIWKRAGKPNHNPMNSYKFAQKGGNSAIIADFEKHGKFKKP